MPNLSPHLKDIRWGSDFAQTFDVLRHPVRDPGGNPVLVYRHGGGATLRDKRLPWIASGNGNPLAFYCNNITSPHFDVISIGTRQAAWDLPMGSSPKNDDFGWQAPKLGRSVFPPHVWDEFKLAIIAIKARAADLGINPNKIIVMGTSFGADTFITLALTPPISGTGISRFNGETRGFDSTVAGVIAHQIAVDLRNSFQEKPVTMLASDLVYTDANRRLTLAGAFSFFDMVAAGGQVTLVSGTAMNAGVYGVDYVDPAGAYIVLDRSAGSDASDALINFRGYPQTLDLTSCTWNTAGNTLTKTDAFKVFGHVGKPIVVRSGTNAVAAAYTIASRVSKDAITFTATCGADDAASNLSVYSSGDQGLWSIFKDMFGANTNAEFDKVPRAFKRALSAVHYLERGITKYWVPTLVVSEQTGDGVKPYGVLSTGDPHDSRQVEVLVNAARSKGLDCEGFVPPGAWDDGDVNRDAQSARMMAWMKRVVEAV